VQVSLNLKAILLYCLGLVFFTVNLLSATVQDCVGGAIQDAVIDFD